jgi:hypothetical protein
MVMTRGWGLSYYDAQGNIWEGMTSCTEKMGGAEEVPIPPPVKVLVFYGYDAHGNWSRNGRVSQDLNSRIPLVRLAVRLNELLPIMKKIRRNGREKAADCFSTVSYNEEFSSSLISCS